MAKAPKSAAERILDLTAFAAARCRNGNGITLSDIVDNVPGYETDGPRAANGDLKAGTDQWEAVRKRLTRDIKDLREQWGIQLDFDEADHCYRLAPAFFTGAERRALFAAAALISVQGAPGSKLGDLGAAIDDSAALVIVRLHGLVADLRRAIATRTAVEFRHHGRDRHLQPYALGMWKKNWYVAGRDIDRDSTRRFRLDRIDPGDPGDPGNPGNPGNPGEPTIRPYGSPSAYGIPGDFDANREFDLDPNAWGTDPAVRARVRVGLDHVDAFLNELGGEVVDRDEQSAILELDVRHYISFRTRLLGFRGSAVVLSPPVLVDFVRDHLVALTGIS
jgi:hypothetical protein